MSATATVRYGVRMAHPRRAHDEAQDIASREPRAARAPAVRWVWCPFGALSGAQVHAALALRAAVFVVEQACVFVDPDAFDLASHHLLGYLDHTGEKNGSQLIAYLRVTSPGAKYDEPSIGRVVTSPAHRGLGLGFALMTEGLARTRASYHEHPIRVSAQQHLSGFYARLGFEIVSPVYLEDGIAHVEMLAR
ncbi:MAG: GNAT family N-acetyltransferase [Pseudomonadota bacterium]|nr:GNAT family N-acetyltransferase [Pseudomonadota bacterium]